MSKYIKFDQKFIAKFWEKLAKQERHCMDVYDGKCAKEIFVNRTLHKWFSGKYIATILDKETGAWSNSGDITVKRKAYLAIGGFQFQLGRGESISVYAADPTVTKFMNGITLSEWSMKKAEFYEIDEGVWNSIHELFTDDREDQTWELAAHSETGIGFETHYAPGKDVDDAINRYYREHKIKLYNLQLSKQ